LSAFNVYALIVLVMRSLRLRIAHFSSAQKILIRVLVVMLFVANWGYLLLHWRNF
jgi:hypothetical protein